MNNNDTNLNGGNNGFPSQEGMDSKIGNATQPFHDNESEVHLKTVEPALASQPTPVIAPTVEPVLNPTISETTGEPIQDQLNVGNAFSVPTNLGNIESAIPSESNPTIANNEMKVPTSESVTVNPVNVPNQMNESTTSVDANVNEEIINPTSVMEAQTVQGPISMEQNTNVSEPMTDPSTMDQTINLSQVEPQNPFLINSNAQDSTGNVSNAGVNLIDNNSPQVDNNIIQAVPTPPIINEFQNELNGKNKKNDKKGMSKTTIFILAILLICVIGAGLYYVLNMSGKKTSAMIKTKDLTLELGSELSTNVSDYATIEGYDINKCQVDTSKIDKNVMGSYSYNVTCGNTSKEGNVIIQDNTAPNVLVKEVSVVPNTSVTLEDFIVSCTDVSNCSYELEDTTVDLNSLITTEGTHKFNIVVSDDYDNKTSVEVTLNVTYNIPVKFMNCAKESEMDNDLKASVIVSYNYGINESDEIVSTEKIYTYTFEVESDYQSVKDNYNSTGMINEHSGVASFDDSELEITLTEIVSDINSEFNTTNFPMNYTEAKQFQKDLGMVCKNR